MDASVTSQILYLSDHKQWGFRKERLKQHEIIDVTDKSDSLEKNYVTIQKHVVL
jgi:hypothetical protein